MSRPVHILTTEGPVLIQSIAEEDPAVRSVVCVDGRAEALPMSAAYDAFVRRPTGLIERFTGHGSYRMDVAARVDDGRSWQLAVYIAHVVALQGSEGPAIYATGEVDRDGAVRPVAFVDRKLQTLGPAEAGAVVLVPAGEGARQSVDGVSVVPVNSVADALAAVGLKEPDVKAVAAAKPARPEGGRFRAAALAGLGAIALFWLGYDPARWAGLAAEGKLLELEKILDGTTGVGRLQSGLFRTWMTVRKPDADGIKVETAILAAASATACGSAAHAVPSGTLLPSGEVVCGAEIRAYAPGNIGAVFGRLAFWPDGLGAGPRPARTLRGSAETTGRSWRIDFEGTPSTGAVLRLALIAGPVEISGSQPWYVDLLSARQGSEALDAAVRRLDRLGYAAGVHDLTLP